MRLGWGSSLIGTPEPSRGKTVLNGEWVVGAFHPSSSQVTPNKNPPGSFEPGGSNSAKVFPPSHSPSKDDYVKLDGRFFPTHVTDRMLGVGSLDVPSG
jgi:hypothetical protein